MGNAKPLEHSSLASWTRSLGKVSLFTIAVTVVSYWISFEDRISSRHEAAWNTIRAAVTWTQSNPYRWGNVGQIDAVQTLVRHCGSWWRDTPFAYVFELVFQDCVDLNSLSLERMELGSLKGAGANFSQSNFACTNLTIADLKNSNLQGASFRGAELSGADLRGADLTKDVDLRLANVSWARFDTRTKVDASTLKCACITVEQDENNQPYRHITADQPAGEQINDVLRKLKACPSVRNKCEPSVMEAWKCAE